MGRRFLIFEKIQPALLKGIAVFSRKADSPRAASWSASTTSPATGAIDACWQRPSRTPPTAAGSLAENLAPTWGGCRGKMMSAALPEARYLHRADDSFGPANHRDFLAYHLIFVEDR